MKSADGKEFTSIGVVAGNGTTTNVNEYSFKDSNVDYELNYYKLVQTDINGKSEEFGPIVVRSCSSIKSLTATLIPTTNSNAPDILVSAPDQGRYVFTVYSLDGKPITKFEKQLMKGLNIVELKDSQYSAAIYVLTIEGTKEAISVKLPIGIRF